jgi:cysteine desulfurase/selenocysteine lyase
MDIELVRQDFPQLKTKINNKDLVYLDNGATTLKPNSVIQSLNKYYQHEVANVHRGVHSLSEMGTKRFEETRIEVQHFINATFSHEIIFTKGTTDSLNLLAQTFGEKHLALDDEILISTMEHHSNIVPWQMIAEKRKAKVIEIPITDDGEIELETIKKLINPKVKLLSICHISNTLGTINPIKEIIELCHQYNIQVCIDAAQSISHMPLDVKELDCDYLVFSAHKMYGPNGVGVLYGKEKLLNELPPYQGGGAMISTVAFSGTSFNQLPFKFEAGTPVIAEVIAFKEALIYLKKIGLENIFNREHDLLKFATDQLVKIPGVKIIGMAKNKASVLSFTIDGIHPHDLGTLLNQQGIAIRTGHHCTQPLMKRMNTQFTARATFSFYNTKAEIEYFITGIKKSLELLK